MIQLPERSVITDVLVIGSGAAGMMAAIRAQEHNAKVMLITKGRLLAGATVMARGGFQAAVGHSDPDDSPEVHFQDTLRAGGGLNNQNLVRIMTKDILGIVKDLEQWGIELVKDGNRFAQKYREGCSYPRHLHYYDETGKALMKCLSEQIKLREIPVLIETMALKIVIADGKYKGVLALNYGTGEFYTITAKALIIASGGAGRVFAETDNPPVLTGDGYSLAFEAGLDLIDLEMIDFQMAVCFPEKMKNYPPNSSAWISAGARLYNDLGERFMRKYEPEKLERTSRALINRSVGKELFDGKGTRNGGVYLDLSDIPRDKIERIGPNIARTFQRNGVDLTYQPMELTQVAHTFLGGIAIDENCETSIAGVYAAGEVTGGIHGANRLGGNAVSDPLVFGAVSGVNAANYANEFSMKQPKFTVVEALDSRLRFILENTDGIETVELQKEIRSIMTEHVGVVRDEPRLRLALEKLCRLEPNLDQLYVRGETDREKAHSFKQAVETINMHMVGKLVATAALARTESRGTHFRADFPTNNGNWVKHIALDNDGNRIRYRLLNLQGEEN